MDNQKQWKKEYWSRQFKKCEFGSPEWQRVMQKYLNSEEWKEIRSQVLLYANGKCNGCKNMFANKDLDVHHLTYERVGNELRGDLQALCFTCHQKADKLRECHNQERNNNTLFEARVSGYVTKKWGELWSQNHLYEEAEEIFISAMYKKWCAINERTYNYREKIPYWFDESLRDNIEIEAIEDPGGNS